MDLCNLSCYKGGMPANSRLTIAVHALTWMALAQRRGQSAMTSDQIAASINTNPVIVRRSLGDLRRAGLVQVRRGSGPGLSLGRRPNEISLLAVFEAVEDGPLFAMHHTEQNQGCPVGRGIQPALGSVYARAETALRRQLRRTTIEDVLGQTLTHQVG
jgi:Rrf2 family protein